MKELFRIVFVLILLICVETSAGMLPTFDQTEKIQSKNAASVYSAIPEVDLSVHGISEASEGRRSIEPAVLFLFGIGIIGMIFVHRLKFQ